MITHDWHEKIILIVEDEHINFRYLQEILKKTQAQILRAENGLEAIETAKEKNVDLILMDIKMPVMNGFEATQKIKEKYPKIKVIAQTAYSSEADKQLAYRYGCSDFLSKPISQEELFKTVNKHLEKEGRPKGHTD